MPNPSRRAVLGAGVFLAAAGAGAGLGFGRSVHHKVAVAPPPPPASLTTALSAHRALIGMCAAALAADPAAVAKVTPLRTDLLAHADALAAVLETFPGWRFEQSARSTAAAAVSPPNSASPASPAAPAPTLGTVRAAVERQAAQVAATCLGWPLPDPASGAALSDPAAAAGVVVPLLGSIAACLSVHVGVLA